MKNKKLEANLSMAVSKVFSGLNMNALKVSSAFVDESADRSNPSLHVCGSSLLGNRVVYASGKIIRQR